MNNRNLLVVALCLIAGGALHAQTGTIAVKGGTKFVYGVVADSHITQSIQGQEMGMDSKTDGTLEMAVKKVTPSQIDWTYGLTKAHLKISGSMLPKAKDSTIKGTPVPFSTDLTGHIVSAPSGGNDLQALMSGGFQKVSVAQMFSPAISHAAKPGDTWEETSADTIDNPAMPGISMMSKRTIKFTYDGIVDTLNMKLGRVRAEVTSMSLEGSGKVQGMDMAIDGDGTTMTTNYYGVDNGVLVAANTAAEINARISISGAMSMVIPMTVKLNSASLRKGI